MTSQHTYINEPVDLTSHIQKVMNEPKLRLVFTVESGPAFLLRQCYLCACVSSLCWIVVNLNTLKAAKTAVFLSTKLLSLHADLHPSENCGKLPSSVLRLISSSCH